MDTAVPGHLQGTGPRTAPLDAQTRGRSLPYIDGVKSAYGLLQGLPTRHSSRGISAVLGTWQSLVFSLEFWDVFFCLSICDLKMVGSVDTKSANAED